MGGEAHFSGARSANLRSMHKLAATILGVGAATCALGILTKYPSTTVWSRAGQLGCAAAFLVLAVLVLVARPARWTLFACVVVAVGVLGVLMALSKPIGMGPLFYLWPVVFTAYFYPPRALAGMLAAMAVSLGVGLAANPDEHLLVDTFVGVCVSVGLMGAMVAGMTRQQHRLRAELARAASTDPLTGLLNRRAFDTAFAGLIAAARDGDGPLAVVLVDLDHFKRFNDSHGHLAGDAALRLMAGVLAAQSRAGDAVCRFGGEEFIVALPHTGAQDAAGYVNRVAEALAGAEQAGPGPFSLSAGIAVLPLDGLGYESLVARADDALYGAKNAGRATVAWHNPGGGLETRPARATAGGGTREAAVGTGPGPTWG